ncbi:MAG: GGDEF domain-containing protein [Sulfurimonas sp.]|nr:GGDEF domain-containing protein [Sulfurimonas sp.]
MLKASFSTKIILAIIFFTLFVTAFERYLLSENITSQFKKSKESKNTLLINTISPILSLNITLGLDTSNVEYLKTIINQNSDIEFVELLDQNGKALFHFVKNPDAHLNVIDKCINISSKILYDSITQQKVGTVLIHYSNEDLNQLIKKNKTTTLQIFALITVLLLLFIFFVRRSFRDLRALSEYVLSYNPKLKNVTLVPSSRNDEIGVIQNAIVSLLRKIDNNAKELDAINHTLEEKVLLRTAEIEIVNRKLQLLSTTDPLTEISNRRHFEQIFREMWELARRKETQIALIMCDIDHFKHVNDTYGHQIGDEVLISVAQNIKKSLKRSTDLVARYGGEEFIIVLYDTGAKGAFDIAAGIQNNLKNLKFETMKNRSITLSFGVSACPITQEFNGDTLINNADKALYSAKEKGRDRIIVHI